MSETVATATPPSIVSRLREVRRVAIVPELKLGPMPTVTSVVAGPPVRVQVTVKMPLASTAVAW